MTTDDVPPLDERIPCPDDHCVGVLDATGTCGTCGLRGELPARVAAAALADADGATRAEAAAGAAGDDAAGESAAGEAGAEDEAGAPDERVPCGDEMCTGILGADGRCGTCGRAG